MEVIAQGAEAIIKKDGNRIIKDRIEKKYRHPELDKQIRKRRTKKEGKILKKVASIIAVPKKIHVDDTVLSMDFVDKPMLAQHLDEDQCLKVGEMVAQLHAIGITHGDLTTSNILVGPVLIDFGLAKSTHRVEDFAMDLHLFKSCLISRHPTKAEKCFNAFWKGYQKFDKVTDVLLRIQNIEKRGRYQVRN